MSDFENESLWDVIINREKHWLHIGNGTTYLTKSLLKKSGQKVNQPGTMYNNKAWKSYFIFKFNRCSTLFQLR